MNIRHISMSLAVAAALGAGPALAQGTVARLSGLEGNVLVSQGDAMVAGTNGQRLPVGARLVSTAGAKATVIYDTGCEVPLKENQRFTVSTGACAALLAAVEPVGPAAGAIGGGTAAGTAAAGGGTVTAMSMTGGLVLGATFGLMAYGVYNGMIKSDNVSPN